MCSAVQTFANSVDSTLSDVKNADSVSAAAADLSEGLQKAADELRTSLNDLGKPSTSDGGKAKSAVQKLGNQVSDSADAIRKLITPPPETLSEVASTFTDIGSEIRKSVDVAKSTATTLKGLKPSGTLKKAFQDSSQCKKLKTSLQSS